MKEALKIDSIRAALDTLEVEGLAFVLFAAQEAPFSLVGLVADGRNYLAQSIPVQPGQQAIVVPLIPPPRRDSELWWAALAGTAIAGMAALLVQGEGKRLLGRKASVARDEVWTGSSIV